MASNRRSASWQMDIPRLCSREPCVIKRRPHKMAPQKSQGYASWSLVWLVRDSQGVLPSRRLGAVLDGHHRGTLSPHVLVQGRSIEETLRVTTSTDELKVKVLPHMAESHVSVLINNSAVGTESKLLVPPLEVKRLPHEALVMVEVRQQELLVCTYMELGRCNSCQARCTLAGEGGEGCRKIFLQTLMSVQRDPVCRGGELVWGALHEEAFPPENRQPMFGYYLRKV